MVNNILYSQPGQMPKVAVGSSLRTIGGPTGNIIVNTSTGLQSGPFAAINKRMHQAAALPSTIVRHILLLIYFEEVKRYQFMSCRSCIDINPLLGIGSFFSCKFFKLEVYFFLLMIHIKYDSCVCLAGSIC